MKIKDTRLEDWTKIFILVEKENARQLEKWGSQDKHIFEWSMWAAEEFGEFIKAVNQFNYGRDGKECVIEEGIQTITLLMKIVDGLLNTREEE